MGSFAIDLKNNYINWLNENIDHYEVRTNVYRLSLPFLDRHNDMLDIYILKQDDDSFIITDDGNTINDLLFSGFDLFNSKRRKELFSQIINSFGVFRKEDNSLYIKASMNNLPLKKHLLAQCIQKVDDLFYLARPNVKSLFLEDVESYLLEKGIRFIQGASFTGKSGFPVQYDFSIPPSKTAYQREIKVVNNLSTDYAKNIIFGWNDIQKVRKQNSQLFTFIQDTDKKVKQDSIQALKEYNITPVLWGERNSVIDQLTA